MNQGQQIYQVTQEDLAKTQVLNLNDVQEIAKFERTTSKRPAILFAIAGVLAITLGTAYPNIMAAIDNMPSTVSSSIVEKVESQEETINDTPAPVVPGETGSCIYTSGLNGDGTQGTITYNFVFKNGLLQSYTKTLVLNKVQEAGLGTINIIYNTYKPFDAFKLTGYEMATNYTQTGVEVVMKADLTTLDKTQLTPAATSQFYSNVEYNLGDAKEVIYANLTPASYVCQ